MNNRISARQLAFEVLEAVEFDDAYANLIMPKRLAKAGLEPRDGGFAQELAYGTLRWQLLYDEIIEFAAQRDLETIDTKALIVLRLGAHQLLELETPPHAAISETVDLAKAVLPEKLIGFVNAVLRRISERTRNDWMQKVLAGLDDEVDRFAVRYSHPVWIVRSLKQALKLDGREAELEALLAADNVQPKVSLVALPGLIGADEISAKRAEAHNASPLGFTLESGDPARIDAVQRGSARVQDQGSQLVALALSRFGNTGKQEAWADFCAGPGGKAALLGAEARLAGATLECTEVSEHRTRLVKQALSAVVDAGANIKVRTGDSREIGDQTPNKFDRIMLDAPCSGLGALRRRPEARWRKSSRDIAELNRLQLELLESAVAAAKVGGLVAYVTCSPHLAETTAIVDAALKRFPELELLDSNGVLSEINPELELNRDRKTTQLWPHVHGTDAMFIALLRKGKAAKQAARQSNSKSAK